jgi:hypothetical protein
MTLSVLVTVVTVVTAVTSISSASPGLALSRCVMYSVCVLCMCMYISVCVCVCVRRNMHARPSVLSLFSCPPPLSPPFSSFPLFQIPASPLSTRLPCIHGLSLAKTVIWSTSDSAMPC